MSIFKWIEFEEELTTRVEVPVSVLALLEWIPGELSLKAGDPDSGPVMPSFDDLERAAEFALGQRCRSKNWNGVDALIGQLETLPKDDPWTGYPERLPKNPAFVLVAYSLFLVDQSIGHFSENEHSLAFGAMAEACHAMHTAGYYHGTAVGLIGMSIDRTSKASNAAHARNAENRSIKSDAFEWLDDHFEQDGLTNEGAAEKLSTVVPVTFSTRLSYVKKWKASRSVHAY